MDVLNEQPFRHAFLLYWIVAFLLRLYFQFKVRGSERMTVRNKKGAVRGFQLLALAYLLLLLYPLTSWLDFARLPLPAWFRWSFGLMGLMSFILLFSASHLALGKNWSGLVEIHKEHALVRSGPYRLVRHPMYSAFFLSCAGIFMFTANWLLSAFYTAATLFMYFSRITSEEAIMEERFGDEYREYASQTGGLFPLLRKGARL